MQSNPSPWWRGPLQGAVLIAWTLLLAAGSQAAPPSPPPVVPENIEFTPSLPFGQGGGQPLRLEMARPKAKAAKPRPAVVFIHGGGWAGSDRTNGRPIILLLAAKGFVAVSIDYRLSGAAGFPAQLEDCKCAVRFLRAHAEQYHLDPARIGVAGGSAGGHLAALVALQQGDKSMEGTGGWEKFESRVSAVADLYGVSDLTAMIKEQKLTGAVIKLMRGAPEEKPELYRQASPLALVQRGAPPFYLAHGDKDTLVPYTQSERLAEALRAVGTEVTLRPMTGMGHGAIGTLPDYVKAEVAEFFIKTLGPVEP